eukprot:scaffold35331_cov26-Tisochrysis_lutea.AAC.2
MLLRVDPPSNQRTLADGRCPSHQFGARIAVGTRKVEQAISPVRPRVGDSLELSHSPSRPVATAPVTD